MKNKLILCSWAKQSGFLSRPQGIRRHTKVRKSLFAGPRVFHTDCQMEFLGESVNTTEAQLL